MRYIVRMRCDFCDWEVTSDAKPMPISILIAEPHCPNHPENYLWLEITQQEVQHGKA